MFCPYCGRSLPNDSVVCHFCGYQIRTAPFAEENQGGTNIEQIVSTSNDQHEEIDSNETLLKNNSQKRKIIGVLVSTISIIIIIFLTGFIFNINSKNAEKEYNLQDIEDLIKSGKKVKKGIIDVEGTVLQFNTIVSGGEDKNVSELRISCNYGKQTAIVQINHAFRLDDCREGMSVKVKGTITDSNYYQPTSQKDVSLYVHVDLTEISYIAVPLNDAISEMVGNKDEKYPNLVYIKNKPISSVGTMHLDFWDFLLDEEVYYVEIEDESNCYYFYNANSFVFDNFGNYKVGDNVTLQGFVELIEKPLLSNKTYVYIKQIRSNQNDTLKAVTPIIYREHDTSSLKSSSGEPVVNNQSEVTNLPYWCSGEYQGSNENSILDFNSDDTIILFMIEADISVDADLYLDSDQLVHFSGNVYGTTIHVDGHLLYDSSSEVLSLVVDSEGCYYLPKGKTIIFSTTNAVQSDSSAFYSVDYNNLDMDIEKEGLRQELSFDVVSEEGYFESDGTEYSFERQGDGTFSVMCLFISNYSADYYDGGTVVEIDNNLYECDTNRGVYLIRFYKTQDNGIIMNYSVDGVPQADIPITKWDR